MAAREGAFETTGEGGDDFFGFGGETGVGSSENRLDPPPAEIARSSAKSSASSAAPPRSPLKVLGRSDLMPYPELSPISTLLAFDTGSGCFVEASSLNRLALLAPFEMALSSASNSASSAAPPLSP